MSPLPLWGELQKANDDPQTILEAVAAAITAHEADPTAHLGDGESLSVHKHDPVIDHPAESVVADKIPYQTYNEFFVGSAQNAWSVEEGTAGRNQDRLIEWSLSSQSDFAAVMQMPYTSGAGYPDADLIMQFQLQLAGQGSSDGSNILAWANDSPFDNEMIVFEKDGQDTYYRIYLAGSVVEEYQLSDNATFNGFVQVRWNAEDEVIEMRVDGLLVSEYATVNWKDFVFANMWIYGSRSSNTGINGFIRDWKATYNMTF